MPVVAIEKRKHLGWEIDWSGLIAKRFDTNVHLIKFNLIERNYILAHTVTLYTNDAFI